MVLRVRLEYVSQDDLIPSQKGKEAASHMAIRRRSPIGEYRVYQPSPKGISLQGVHGRVLEDCGRHPNRHVTALSCGKRLRVAHEVAQ
jgi:hypothetical protein